MRKRLRFLFRIDDENPLTGWHALALVAVFFGIIIVVNLIMAVFATGTFPGVVVRSSYVASQRYNSLLEAARAQEASGLVATVESAGGDVAFRLRNAEGNSVHGLTVSAIAGRPSTEREDRRLVFEETGEGYRAVAGLAAGRWRVDVEARRGAALVFRTSSDVYVDPESSQ